MTATCACQKEFEAKTAVSTDLGYLCLRSITDSEYIQAAVDMAMAVSGTPMLNMSTTTDKSVEVGTRAGLLLLMTDISSDCQLKHSGKCPGGRWKRRRRRRHVFMS